MSTDQTNNVELAVKFIPITSELASLHTRTVSCCEDVPQSLAVSYSNTVKCQILINNFIIIFNRKKVT